MEEKKLEHFTKLFSIDCNDKTEKKNNGSKDLTYLSWCFAWAEVKNQYPDANYEIMKFGETKLPYVYDEKTGYMVFTRVEIEGIEHEMWLPVMDSANKAMKDKPYAYKVKEYKNHKWTGGYIDKSVEAATMFDINKTIMRCLTKNLAMFGLGLYIYAGEDSPENIDNIEEQNKQQKTSKKGQKKEEQNRDFTPYDFEPQVEIQSDMDMLMGEPIMESQKQFIKEFYTPEEIKKYITSCRKSKLSDLTYAEAKLFLDTYEKNRKKEMKEKQEVF